MHIKSWVPIYKGLEGKVFTNAILVTPIMDVKLGSIVISNGLDVMDDLIVTVSNLKNQKILSFNCLDASTLESDKKPFLNGLYNDFDKVFATYYRIRFEKAAISLHFRQIYGR